AWRGRSSKWKSRQCARFTREVTPLRLQTGDSLSQPKFQGSKARSYANVWVSSLSRGAAGTTTTPITKTIAWLRPSSGINLIRAGNYRGTTTQERQRRLV